MQSIIDMNNEAALLTENGLYKEALKTLDVALSKLQKSLSNDDGDLEMAFVPHSAVREQPQKPISHFDDDAEMDGDFIYRSPIRSNGNGNSNSTSSEEEEVDLDVSIIILFNMALANHLRAIEGKNGVNTQRLRKALKLYEFSFLMQMRGSGQLNMTQVLALVNNCGQIYKQLNLERKASKFFQHLLSTIMTMVEIGEAQEVEQMDGFLWTASQLILVDPALAPAA
jgi:tetratricopeptide (TPR) repeat protein